MIGAAKKSIVLATFDLRADESGTDLLAALDQAAKMYLLGGRNSNDIFLGD